MFGIFCAPAQLSCYILNPMQALNIALNSELSVTTMHCKLSWLAVVHLSHAIFITCHAEL